MRNLKILCATVLVALTLSACADNEQLDDAPVGIIDDSPTFVMTNVDQFPNMAMRCYEGALIVTTTRDYGDAVNILPDFAPCADGDPIPEGQK